MSEDDGPRFSNSSRTGENPGPFVFDATQAPVPSSAAGFSGRIQGSSHGVQWRKMALWRRGWADQAGIDWLVRSGTKPLATSLGRPAHHKAASAQDVRTSYVKPSK